MKATLFISIIFLFSSFCFKNFQIEDKVEVEIKIKNIDFKRKGIIGIAAFSEEYKKFFPSNKKGVIYSGKINVSNKNEEVVKITLKKGKYAISVLHDENENNKIDFNFIGIPKEGYGFSNNPKIMFGPPGFDDCVINFTNNSKIEIVLKY
ncbi:MAG TPA: DUF2141 domain-containing protein [Bacteroidia bacterium]|nr:DUF2141 domain-containing protein [Bacteroidia bacterium]